MANGKTVLVVDDDPGSRRLFQYVMAKTGCEIVTVASGTEALEIAANRTIDLLVTDLMMEGIDGFVLTQTLRQAPTYQALPVIMISARWQGEIHNEEWNNDNTVLMTKPFSPTELISRVNLLLNL